MQLPAKLENRKQGKDETFRNYVDDMCRMFDKVNYPEEAQIHRFMSNLNDKYQDKVVNRIPRTLTEAVDSALWFEDRGRGPVASSAADTASVPAYQDDRSGSNIAQALD